MARASDEKDEALIAGEEVVPADADVLIAAVTRTVEPPRADPKGGVMEVSVMGDDRSRICTALETADSVALLLPLDDEVDEEEEEVSSATAKMDRTSSCVHALMLSIRKMDVASYCAACRMDGAHVDALTAKFWTMPPESVRSTDWTLEAEACLKMRRGSTDWMVIGVRPVTESCMVVTARRLRASSAFCETRHSLSAPAAVSPA